MDPTPRSPEPKAARSAEPSRSAGPARSPTPSRAVSPLPAQAAEPDVLLREILTHLGELRYRTAQRLAREAAGRFPDHPGIRRMNRGLNEWTVTTSPGREPSSTEEFKWLRNPPDAVRGKWVALVGSELVASADTLAEVMATLDSMTLPKIPLVHRLD